MTDTCDVTIVGWTAGKTVAEVVNTYASGYLTKGEGDIIYVIRGTELFQSTDSMETLTKISDLPAVTKHKILITPLGYFIRCSNEVYRSSDLINWTLSFTAALGGLYHSFDYYYNDAAETLYVYLCDYSGVPDCYSERHKVYRGTITAENETWETILEFYHQTEYTADPETYAFLAHHVQLVMTDKSNGDVWVGTGDHNDCARLMRSTDNGNTFTIIGSGAQAYRSLAIWFTQDYVYWGMDSSESQRIFRIPRSSYSINDLELVAKLDNGSLWYVCKVTDNVGDDVFLIGGSPEGQIRDWRIRLFAMKEYSDGRAEVQEVCSMASYDPSQYLWYPRLDPQIQDSEGNIYVTGYNVEGTPYATFRLFKMRLSDWVSGYIPPEYTWKSNYYFKDPYRNL